MTKAAPADRLEQAVALLREEARVRAEEAYELQRRLDESQHAFDELYHDSPVGFITLDKKGVILDVNRSAAEMLGRDAARLRRKPLLVFVDRADATILLAHLHRCAVAACSVELRLRDRVGPTRVVQLTTTRSSGAGMPPGAFRTVLTDVTAHREAADGSRAIREQHRDIVETAQEGIAMSDTLDAITFVNRRLAAMLGCDAQSLIGRHVRDVLPVPVSPRDGPGAAGDGFEGALRRSDGSTIWVSISTTAMHNDSGLRVGTLHMYADITEKRDRARIRQAAMRQLVTVQEQERQRIARELHDQFGQHVVALTLGLSRLAELTAGAPEAAEIVDRLREVSDLLVRDTHHLAQELRPSALDHLGLGVALSDYVTQLASRSGLDVDFHCEFLEDLRIPAEVETAIYRVAQEALTNVVKHAAATHASVILERRDDGLQLIVEDDGAGFAVESKTGSLRGRLGLVGMEERTSLIGGSCQVESTPGRGTTVYARFPLPSGDAREENTITAG